MVRLGRYVLAPLAGLLLAGASLAQEMTDVGTPRNETLIVQTFDGKTANPNAQNPFNLYAIWRGFRELGWSFLWASSLDTDFNFDLGVSFTPEQQRGGAEYNFRRIEHPTDELPGLSAFALADGIVYRTYSAYARGLDIVDNVSQLLDRVAKGRDEADGDDWIRRKDEYGAGR